MDSVDHILLRTLATAGRATFADLAARVGLSAPSVAERVRKLEERGEITGYSAIIDPEATGFDLTAFVAVSLEDPMHRDAFLLGIEALACVVECHHIAGDDDYLLKVRAAGTKGLERLISRDIKSILGVTRTRTTVVLSSPVERPFVPAAPLP